MTNSFNSKTTLFGAIALLSVSAMQGQDFTASQKSFRLNLNDPMRELNEKTTASPPFAIRLRIDFYIPSSSVTTLYESVDLKQAFPKGFHIAAWTVSRLNSETPAIFTSSRIEKTKGRKANGDGKFNFNIGYKF